MLRGLAVDGSWSDKWWMKLKRLESLSVVGDTPVGVCSPLHCSFSQVARDSWNLV